jgi:hypothetical protein
MFASASALRREAHGRRGGDPGDVGAASGRRRWTGRRGRRCSPRGQEAGTDGRGLELEGAVFLSILGIARRLVSRYEPLEALVDEPPYGCIDCGMQVVDGEGRVIGTILIPPPVLN